MKEPRYFIDLAHMQEVYAAEAAAEAGHEYIDYEVVTDAPKMTNTPTSAAKITAPSVTVGHVASVVGHVVAGLAVLIWQFGRFVCVLTYHILRAVVLAALDRPATEPPQPQPNQSQPKVEVNVTVTVN